MPVDRLQAVLMTQRPGSAGAHVNALAAARAILQREGLRGFYRAAPATLLRTFIGQAVALNVYAAAARVLAG